MEYLKIKNGQVELCIDLSKDTLIKLWKKMSGKGKIIFLLPRV